MPIHEDAIEVKGLRELQRALKQLDGESQKKLRLVLNVAADIIADDARGKARRDSKTGRAAKSIKSASGQREASVKGGGAKVPYFGWLDFGGKNEGRHPGGKPIVRPFKPEGRYIYSAFGDNYDEVTEALRAGLLELIRESGLEVESSGG